MYPTHSCTAGAGPATPRGDLGQEAQHGDGLCDGRRTERGRPTSEVLEPLGSGEAFLGGSRDRCPGAGGRWREHISGEECHGPRSGSRIGLLGLDLYNGALGKGTRWHNPRPRNRVQRVVRGAGAGRL